MANVSANVTVPTDPVDMSNPLLVGFSSLIEATTTRYSWSTPLLGRVEIRGTGFTYTPDGELSGGTVNSIRIHADNDDPYYDLILFGLDPAALDVTRIDRDDPRTFWNELLEGDDEIGAGLVVGTEGHTVLFGDDLSSATSLPGRISDSGGNDIIWAGRGFDQVTLIGDIYDLRGLTSKIVARYDAGDDDISGSYTNYNDRLIGDAYTLGGFATLLAGDDTVTPLSSGLSWIAGDVYNQTNGTLFGGNDDSTLIHYYEGPRSTPVRAGGDVLFFAAGTAFGGNDTIDCSGSSTGELLAGDIYQINSTAAANIYGGGDSIAGSWGADFIGGDVLRRVAYLDTIVGGDDMIRGGDGNDTLHGEVGDNVLGNVSGGNDSLFGEAGSDVVDGQTGGDLVDGGTGNDTLWGQAGSDTLNGDEQDDRLNGGGSADRLNGGKGDDFLAGWVGDDTLIGGHGTDRLRGGPGADAFDFNWAGETPAGAGRDRIGDFNSAEGDKIDLSTMDAILGGTDDAFSFIGTGPFTGAAGELRYGPVIRQLQGDVDGDGAADFAVELTGIGAVAAGDLIL